MLRSKLWSVAALAALALTLSVGTSAQAADDEGWGTIKGTVVWGGQGIPANPEAKVDKDKPVCLAKGKLLTNELVVNKKNKGVKYVLVWLADPANHKNASFKPPVHKSLKNLPKTIELDQPCCEFAPRMIGLVEGQTLTVKNPAPIPHNFAITSIGGGPTVNPLMPPNTDYVVKGFVPKVFPTTFSCSIHPWMKGWLGVFAHPYFAVTDADGNFEIKNAPAGKFRLVFWQEKVGWVVMKNPKDVGKVIEVKGGGTTDVGKVKLTLSED